MHFSPFTQTYARLLSDRGRLSAAVACFAVAVAVLWCWWAARAQVTLYEISTSARIELDAATYVVQSPLLGRVIGTELRVGRPVRRGDILAELDAAPEELLLRQEQVRAEGIEPALERLRSELQAEEHARAAEQGLAGLSADEAAGRLRAVQADARYADMELERAQQLYAQQLIAQRDLDKARFEAERRHAEAAAAASAARGVPQQQLTRERERDVRVERLRGEIAGLEAERRTLDAAVERLRYEIERRQIRAPVDGVIGEAAILRPGGVVDEGTPIASIVAAGELIVMAEFPPDAAFGRIRPGQSGMLRLDGFPWSEFGAVSATVAHVARERRDGSVRVELTLDPRSTFRGELQHGMPGALEIGVERITPFALLLRTAGRVLTTPQSQTVIP